jgi:hypothetical protein
VFRPGCDRTAGGDREIFGFARACSGFFAAGARVYRLHMSASPRIPPPPMPEVDWSSTAAYLRSCHEWLDAMERWRAETLPGWIEQTRKYLLETALMNPESPVVLPDPQAETRRLSEKPLDTVPEMRLPAID